MGHPLRSAALALLALAVFAPTATAGPLADSAGDCDTQSLSKPFMPWVDPAHYTPQPGGDFEGSLRGWDLDGGAAVVSGNEPYLVGDADDRRSLALPEDSSVTTSAICVGLEHPTMRFFARRTAGASLSTLLVEVLFEDAGGSVRRLPIGAALPSERWTPGLPLPVVANLLPLLPGERTAVAFRFTVLGDASWQLDDLFVDPWRAR